MKNKKIKIREITLMCITVMVLFLFFTGYSLGKGFSETQIEALGKIAKPILIVDNQETLNITSLENENNYEFVVKNYNKNGEISDIKLKYYIEIISDISEKIELKIFKENEEIAIENNKTKEFELLNKEMKEDKYKIVINKKENITTPMKDIFQSIQIKVHSEQERV